jgi:hypothetical protein
MSAAIHHSKEQPAVWERATDSIAFNATCCAYQMLSVTATDTGQAEGWHGEYLPPAQQMDQPEIVAPNRWTITQQVYHHRSTSQG